MAPLVMQFLLHSLGMVHCKRNKIPGCGWCLPVFFEYAAGREKDSS
jgi:hypothetical protein